MRENVTADQFRLKQGEPQPIDATWLQNGWDTRGNPLGDADHPECVAKIVTNSETGKKRFFIKYHVYGQWLGQMVNPQVTTDLGREICSLVRGRFEWKQVSERAFDLYKQFLLTANTLYLRQAAKEA